MITEKNFYMKRLEDKCYKIFQKTKQKFKGQNIGEERKFKTHLRHPRAKK